MPGLTTMPVAVADRFTTVGCMTRKNVMKVVTSVLRFVSLFFRVIVLIIVFSSTVEVILVVFDRVEASVVTDSLFYVFDRYY